MQCRRSRGRVLDGFGEFLRARSVEVGFNAAVLFREVQGQGYAGGYAALARYVAPWRAGFRAEEAGTVRFETGPGEQSQVDWGSRWVYLGETRVRVHVFVMVLGYSRRIFARAYASEGLDSLLNAWLLTWCLTVADERVHGTTHERPVERFRREEASALVAVDRRAPSPRERVESRIVPRDGFVAVESNRYPVPLAWAGREVAVQIRAEEVVIGGEQLEPVRHGRLAGKHQVARWSGLPRRVERRDTAPGEGPPRFDPAFLGPVAEVTARPLSQYAALVEVAT